jgi:predicted DsbA family dithiol-disulfide isomerase
MRQRSLSLLGGVDIDVFSDVVCPWCYIGKRRLEAALAQYDGEVNVRYRPFQLDPNTPHEPHPLIDWLGPRFGGVEAARRMTQQTRGIASVDGIEMDFENAVIANTFDAHRLVWFAGRALGPQVMEALHRAHFTLGLDVASHDVLTDVAVSAGLGEDEVRKFLASTDGVEEVNTELAFARDLGISGVPTFIFANKYAMSGAADPENLLEIIHEVERREAAA